MINELCGHKYLQLPGKKEENNYVYAHSLSSYPISSSSRVSEKHTCSTFYTHLQKERKKERKRQISPSISKGNLIFMAFLISLVLLRHIDC